MMTFLQAAEAVATSEETRMGLWKLFSMGGWLMWPLLALGGVTIFIENVANLEVSKLENGLPFLATIAGGAPMIGFLGTVLGMVQTFMDMAAAGGTVDLSLLASGMYVAMVTTVGGLIVGIPAYFGYNYLVARIEKLVFQMEANSIAFMDILNQPVQK